MVSASYLNMPKCGQIMLLAFCRGIEPIAYSSASPYLYFMVRDFGYSSPSTISSLSAFTLAAFALGQTMTGVLWGRLADIYGRKVCLLVGLTGVLICTVAFGFSTNIYMAISTRFVAGMLNGNVALIRTIVGEIVSGDKVHQSHAFTVLPIAMNIGTILGPMLTGMLADPVHNLPFWFGHSTLFTKFPYLLPNLLAAPLLLFAIFSSALFIQETLDSPKVLIPKHRDWLFSYGTKLKSWLGIDSTSDEMEPLLTTQPQQQQQQDEGGSVRSALTKPIVILLVSYTLIFSHCSFYLQLLPIFLATPRMDSTHTNPLMFNGGLGLESYQIGLLLSITGVFAVCFQLVGYPKAAARFGSLGLHKLALFAFLTYAFVPYLAFLPSCDDSLVIAATATLALGPALGVSFGLAPLEILLTDKAPRGKLATVNGLAQMGMSLARTIGPITFGNLFAAGVEYGVVGLAWWVMTLVVFVQLFIGSRM